jgi:hypothetical protein
MRPPLRTAVATVALALLVLPLQSCRPERDRRSSAPGQLREMALPEVRLRRGTTGDRHGSTERHLGAGSR